jgi:cold shock CspA family protein
MLACSRSKPGTTSANNRPPSAGNQPVVAPSTLNRAWISALAEGRRVAVDMVEEGKGPEAVNIRLS